jgi:hypothetical protein
MVSIVKTVSVNLEQEIWIRANKDNFKLSKFVQEKINEEMKKNL